MITYTITPASAQAAVRTAINRSLACQPAARLRLVPAAAPAPAWYPTPASMANNPEAYSDVYEDQQFAQKGGDQPVITITISAETPSAALDELASFAVVARSQRAQAVAAPARRKASPAPVPIHDDGPICPDHGTARVSQFGGLYCPAKTDAGHCKWTDKAAA